MLAAATSLLTENIYHRPINPDADDERLRPIKRPRGRPRKRPDKLHADKAYDGKKCARALRVEGHQAPHSQKRLESTEKL